MVLSFSGIKNWIFFFRRRKKNGRKAKTENAPQRIDDKHYERAHWKKSRFHPEHCQIYMDQAKHVSTTWQIKLRYTVNQSDRKNSTKSSQIGTCAVVRLAWCMTNNFVRDTMSKMERNGFHLSNKRVRNVCTAATRFDERRENKSEQMRNFILALNRLLCFCRSLKRHIVYDVCRHMKAYVLFKNRRNRFPGHFFY